jgi:hypothetical protein
MSKTATKTVAASSEKMTRDELLATVSPFEFQTCEIVAGRNFPIGEKFDCIKVGISSYGKPYTVISVNGTDKFCDPKNLKVLKPMVEAKVAAAKAALEEAKEATLIVGGTVKNESEKAVLISHHGWFKPKWFPKSLVTKIGDHEDGEQNLYEVPRWKIQADHGPDGVKALQSLQDGYEKMLEPEEKPEPVKVVRTAGKYTGKMKK